MTVSPAERIINELTQRRDPLMELFILTSLRESAERLLKNKDEFIREHGTCFFNAEGIIRCAEAVHKQLKEEI